MNFATRCKESADFHKAKRSHNPESPLHSAAAIFRPPSAALPAKELGGKPLYIMDALYWYRRCPAYR